MPGGEYADAALLASFWKQTNDAFAALLADGKRTVEAALHELNPAWHLVGRVHFNLAENRGDDGAPFAFLATYTHRLSSDGRVQHLPLGEALREYAGARNRERLLSLLLPVQRAAEECDWLRAMVEAREVYHPIRFSANDAFRFLESVPILEKAGVVVRLPAKWNGAAPSRPRATLSIGEREPTGFGAQALLDFRVELMLDGEPLTPAEIAGILRESRGLTLMRGKWIEVDPDQVQSLMLRFRRVEEVSRERGLTFAEASRLLAGAGIAEDAGVPAAAEIQWAEIHAGDWLAGMLEQLRSPGNIDRGASRRQLLGTLRPYQEAGVRWLSLLARLGLGACLADDMGLGKTIQVLALLLERRGARTKGTKRVPSLLVAPASLLSNWKTELETFAPALKVFIAHTSELPAREVAAMSAQHVANHDLVITSYASLSRIAWMSKASWDLVVLDEAQNIKNAAAKQTRAVKALASSARIALTGTPVENRLADLWSIFDFINPGLLGSATEFTKYVRRIDARSDGAYGPLRSLIRPYVLRRLKTDRNVIRDLPDKTEVKTYCTLSRKQAALYTEAVRELKSALSTASGIRRRGIVLAFLTRLKQICNHPSHWLGDAAWDERDSGKLARMRDLVDIIASKQEKVLVFTQYREMAEPLARHLEALFGRGGLVLHGGTPVAQRRHLVKRFQEDELVPHFVLTLKAGGSGLNLTAASHVIHFDRWWNPAVENQATDRAYRIGQKRNVLVHKFVCKGTVEERIDDMLVAKAGLARDLLDGGGEMDITNMDDRELLQLVSLDIHAAMGS
jgi:non-specific serine/threonine protein kinase